MLQALIGLCLVGSGIAIHVDESRGISEADLAQMTSHLRQAIENRTGRSAAVDPSRATCTASDRCVEGIRGRTESEDIVFLTVIGVPTRVRLLAERVRARLSTPSEKVELDLGRSPAAWAEPLSAVAAKLFPERVLAPAQVAAAEPGAAREAKAEAIPSPRAETSPEPGKGFNYAPWIWVGAGAACLAAGTGFGLDSRAARNSAATMPHTDAELDDLRHRAVGNGLVADVLFGLAAVALGVGVGLLVFDGP